MGMSDLSPFSALMHRKVLCVVTVLGLAGLLTMGCSPRGTADDTEAPEEQYEELSFEVNEELLQDELVLDELGVAYRIPEGWQELDEEHREVFRAQVYPLLHGDDNAELLSVYLDPMSGSLYVFTALDDGAETGASAARKRHEEAGYELEYTEFRKDRFVVRQLLFQTGNTVVFRLFFSGPPVDEEFEVSFLIPYAGYEAAARVIESAIGAIDEV